LAIAKGVEDGVDGWGGGCTQASVAFVDEIFKANSAILNSLLSILNERVFDNGSQRVDVPLICMVRAISLCDIREISGACDVCVRTLVYRWTPTVAQ
jgi:hypothetical protein